MPVHVNSVKGIPHRYHYVVTNHDQWGRNFIHPPGIIDREYGGSVDDDEYEEIRFRLHNDRRWGWYADPDEDAIFGIANRIDDRSMRRPLRRGTKDIWPLPGRSDPLWEPFNLMEETPWGYFGPIPGMGMWYDDSIRAWDIANFRGWRWSW